MALAIKEHHTDYHPTLNDYRVMATAAAQVLLDERDKQWEQAIIWGCTNVDWDSTPERFLKLVRARLSAKPPQQETREQQVTAILQATVKETNEKWFEAAEKVARVREEK
jgi:hypothetical protein